MKHIRKFNEAKSTTKFLSKDELDNMSKEEIEKFRYEFLSSLENRNWHKTEEKRYIEELELYTHLRFKQDVIDRYNRWRKMDGEEYKFITRWPNDQIYQLTIDSFKQEYGEPKYIKVDI